MQETIAPKIPKWPFFLGDALLLALAWFIHYESKTPTGRWELFAYVICVTVGAGISIVPFLKEYQSAVNLSESDRLATVVSQIKNLDQITAQISYATSQWQAIREAADQTASSARNIAQGMATEVKSFNEFIQKSNEGENSILRLEVDKLRRAEVEWLQVVVRILDHVFALHKAALRTQQPGVADQLGKFQLACHDASRRIGLTPFIAAPDEPFDAQRHQLMDSAETNIPQAAMVAETIANGFTFQGRLIRHAIVRLQNEALPAVVDSKSTEVESTSASVGD